MILNDSLKLFRLLCKHACLNLSMHMCFGNLYQLFIICNIHYICSTIYRDLFPQKNNYSHSRVSVNRFECIDACMCDLVRKMY